VLLPGLNVAVTPSAAEKVIWGQSALAGHYGEDKWCARAIVQKGSSRGTVKLEGNVKVLGGSVMIFDEVPPLQAPSLTSWLPSVGWPH
jgi:hypothetical protein